MKIVYHIPYTSKSAGTLRRLREKYNAKIQVDENENVSIEVEKRYAAKVQKILSTLI